MKKFRHVVTESAFIVFLFYSNLLMGEFVHTGEGQIKGLGWAVWNIFTASNLAIAISAAVVGSAIFEWVRKTSQERTPSQ